jgi:hypothetical protein
VFVECILHAIPDGAYSLILRVPELCRVSRLACNRRNPPIFNVLRHDTARHKVTFNVTSYCVIGTRSAGIALP